MISALLGAVLERAGDVVRERLDDLAFLWLMNRHTYPRPQAKELLERLAAQVGAKLEMQDPP